MANQTILIVGAGAVGQVYGHHLAKGGTEVGVWVRPVRRAAAEKGYSVTQIPLFGARRTERFVPKFVATNLSELPPKIDAVWLCLPTTSLDEELVRALADACPGAVFVVLAPGHFVRTRIDPIVGARRAVYGIIGMISYVAPLDGSNDPRETSTPAGIAYHLDKTVLSGERAGAMRDALRQGGVPVDVVADASIELELSSAVLMPNIACLDLVGYSFERYRSELASLAADATHESLTVAAALTGQAPPLYASFINSTTLQIGSWIAPRVTPLDVASFLRVHFTKVRKQTELLLGSSVEEARSRGLGCEAMAEVLERFAGERADDGGAAPQRA